MGIGVPDGLEIFVPPIHPLYPPPGLSALVHQMLHTVSVVFAVFCSQGSLAVTCRVQLLVCFNPLQPDEFWGR